MKDNLETAYDMYASHALQALISKLPLLDRDGEFSEGTQTQEQVDSLKNDIARSAHGYAWFMIKNRAEFIDAFKEVKP